MSDPRDPSLADNRYGPDLPYDDVYDADGELAEPKSIDDVLEDLRKNASE